MTFHPLEHGKELLDAVVSWKTAAYTLAAVIGARIFAAPYYLWKQEQDKRIELANRFAPKIDIYLDPKTSGITLSQQATPTGELTWSKWPQFVVGCLTDAQIVDCEARLLSVERMVGDSLEQVLGGEDEHCLWGNYRDRHYITIRPGAPQNACLFSLSENANPVVPVPQTTGRYTLVEGIKVPGRYLLKVVVTAKDTQSRHASFIFTWSSYTDVTLEQIS